MTRRLIPISEDLLIGRMRFENPWWTTDAIDLEYKAMPRRLYFELFFSLANEKQVKRAVVLMGPRRVGKTVMMHHVIDELLSKGHVPKKKIAFINIENPLYLGMSLEELFLLARRACNNADEKGWYVFFDEIQYLKDWEIHLKVLVDSYPSTRFIVSGSAAAALKLQSDESGAGRFTDFLLPPLTFVEYINMRGYEGIIEQESVQWKENSRPYFTTTDLPSLNKHFVDYINIGGYPEVLFSEKIQSDVGRYIKSDIVDKVLLRDLPSLYGIQNVQELNRFFTMLVYHTGKEISLETLAQSSGVNKITLKKYLEYLEAAFLIKLIHRIDDCGKRFQRQNFYKIYLTNPSLRSALFSPLQAADEAMGHMVETAIFSQWLHRDRNVLCYARWGNGEVDMVGLGSKNLAPKWAVEIKWSNKMVGNKLGLKNVLSFCEKNKINEALVTTYDVSGQESFGDTTVYYTPCSVYAYNVGLNTLANNFKRMQDSD